MVAHFPSRAIAHSHQDTRRPTVPADLGFGQQRTAKSVASGACPRRMHADCLGAAARAHTSTYAYQRAIDAKHVPRYPGAFSYRFDRRYQLAELVPCLVHASANTPPMPCRLL